MTAADGGSGSGCALRGPLDECYYADLSNGEHIETGDIVDPDSGELSEYGDCVALNSTTVLTGENSVFPCGGYVLEVWPSATDPAGFAEAISSHLEMLFAASCRGVNIEMTLYLPRADWWVHCQILYEYGI